MDSEMAGPIWLKLGVLMEGICQIDMAKDFFESVNFDLRTRLVCHKCLY